MGLHHPQQRRGTADVDVVVGQRDVHRLPDRLFGRKVDHGVDGVGGEHLTKGIVVADVDRIGGQRAPGQLLHPLQGTG
jgi:hypothetical protein